MLRRAALLGVLLALMSMSPAPYATEVLYWCVPEGDGGWVPTTFPEYCDRPQIPAYPVPLRVAVVAEEGVDRVALSEATRDAVGAWNGWLGDELLVVVEPLEHPDVWVWGAAEQGNILGMADLWTVYGQQVSIAWMYGNADVEVLAHEIGHLLGLRHDPTNPHSIMYPYRSGQSKLASPERQDLQLIRAWYSL